MIHLKYWPARLLGALLVSTGLLFTAQPASATFTPEIAPPSLIEHLRSQLKSKDAMAREWALVDVISLANCTSTCTISLHSLEDKKIRIENETGIGTLLDLRALVPDLIRTYRTAADDGHRLLAVSGLINIGDDTTLAQLIDESTLQSDDVSRKTHASLVSFYLEKYPELTEKTLKRKSLDLEDIERAKKKRDRDARKSAAKN